MSLFGGITLPHRPDPENVRKLQLLSVPMIGKMIKFGMRIDVDRLNQLSSEFQVRMGDLKCEILNEIPSESLDHLVGLFEELDNDESSTELSVTPPEFDTNSSKKVAELLYDVLHLHQSEVEIKRTKSGGLSTGKKTLEQLKRLHPVVKYILDYREVQKLDGTYAKALPRIARFHPKGPECPLCGRRHYTDEWRVHTDIATTRTATRRKASRNPNLSNIPGRSKDGRAIRSCFVASAGHRICQRDWAQIELRLMADQSGDEKMSYIYSVDGDIHVYTAMQTFNIEREEDVDKLAHRAPSKNTNFAVCVAAGQKVLTDRGLVPIERVTCSDMVWDGVEWVSQLGPVYKGFKEVITHDNLTATPDHKVWREDGIVTTHKKAATQGRRLAHTEIGGIAIRFTGSTFRGNPSKKPVRAVRFCNMHGVWEDARDYCQQFAATQNYQLHVQEDVRRPEVQNSTPKIYGDKAAVQQPQLRIVSKLRGAWNTVSLWVSERISRLCADRAATPRLQESGHWQSGQRWTLSEREYTAREPIEELAEQTNQCLHLLSRRNGYSRGLVRPISNRLPGVQTEQNKDQELMRAGRGLAGNSPENPTETLEKGGKTYAHVYDLVNCGPRRRFTCSGRLVSNCYLISGQGLLDLMALTYATAGKPLPDYITEEWCDWFIQKWFSVYKSVGPYLEGQKSIARRHGIVWTPTGSVRRIPETRSCHQWIVEAGERQGCNHGIQGYSADLMDLACGEMQAKFNVLKEYDIETFPLMQIYDELLIEVPEDDCDTVQAVMEEVMDNVLIDKDTGDNLCKVPIKSEGKIMPTWMKD